MPVPSIDTTFGCFIRTKKSGWIRSVYPVLVLLFYFLSNTVSGQTFTVTWPLVADGNAVTTGNVTASTISGGSGLASVIFFSSSGANAEGWPTTSARNLDDYFEYQISPAAGYDLTLTSISFEHFTSKKASPGSVYYSTDGFSTENQLLTFTSLEGIPTATSQSVNIVVPNGQTLSIRIYVWRMFKTDTKFYNKNVILTGTASSSASSTLNVTPNIIDFGYVNVDSTSSEMSYEISGENLDGNPVTISAPTDFKVSLSSGTGFTSTVTLPYSGNTLPATTIYCLFQPLAADTEYNSIIGNTGGGAATQNVQVTGTTIVDCISGAVAVLSSIGVSNPENATGVADLDGATLTGISRILTLDLTGGGSLASGGEVVVYWNSGHPRQVHYWLKFLKMQWVGQHLLLIQFAVVGGQRKPLRLVHPPDILGLPHRITGMC